MANVFKNAAQFPGASGRGSHPLISSDVSGCCQFESKNNSNGGSFMNKLSRPALLAFSAMLTLILVSCSGSDGSDGKPGAKGPDGTWSGCTAELSEDGTEAVVKCGGQVIGTLTKGEVGEDGLEGPTPFCTTSPKAGGGYTITCRGKTPFDIQDGGGIGEGNCALKDSKGTLTISCNEGAQNFRLSLCGYEKPSTFNEATHFCSKDFVAEGSTKGTGETERVVPRCGTAKSAYDVGISYCARSLIIELSRTAGKTLVAVEAGTDYPSDMLDSAFYSDIDKDVPVSANWKVLPQNECFAGAGAAKSCGDFLAVEFKAESENNILKSSTVEMKKETGSDEEKEEAKTYDLAGLSGCGFGKFYDLSKSLCADPEDCTTIMKNANTCYSGTVPAAQAANAQIKKCAPKIGGVEKKIWYDANNVASCDESRTTIRQAIVCDNTGTREVSDYQTGLLDAKPLSDPSDPASIDLRDGSKYNRKVSCYLVKDPTECPVSLSEYVASGPLAGTCALVKDADVPQCPGGYKLSDKAYFKKICSEYIKDAMVYGSVLDGATNIAAPILYSVVKAANGGNSFVENFASACVGDTLLTAGTPGSSNARYMAYSCDFEPSMSDDNADRFAAKYALNYAAATAAAPGKWSVYRPGSGTSSSYWRANNNANSQQSDERGGSWRIVRDKAVKICQEIKAQYDLARTDKTKSFCVLDVTAESCGAAGASPSLSPATFGKCFPAANQNVPLIASGYANVKYAISSDGNRIEANATADMCAPGSVIPTSATTENPNRLCVANNTYSTPTCPVGYQKDSKGNMCYQTITSSANCPPGFSYNVSQGKCLRGTEPAVDPVCAYSGKLNTNGNARCEIGLGGTGTTYCSKGFTISADGTKCNLISAAPVCVSENSPHFTKFGSRVIYSNGKCIAALNDIVIPAWVEIQDVFTTTKTLNTDGTDCWDGEDELGKDSDGEEDEMASCYADRGDYRSGNKCYEAANKYPVVASAAAAFPGWDFGTDETDPMDPIDLTPEPSGLLICKNPLAEKGATEAEADGKCYYEEGGSNVQLPSCYISGDARDANFCYLGITELDNPYKDIAGLIIAAGITDKSCLASGIGVITETKKTGETPIEHDAETVTGVGRELCPYTSNSYNGIAGYSFDPKIAATEVTVPGDPLADPPIPPTTVTIPASGTNTCQSDVDPLGEAAKSCLSLSPKLGTTTYNASSQTLAALAPTAFQQDLSAETAGLSSADVIEIRRLLKYSALTASAADVIEKARIEKTYAEGEFKITAAALNKESALNWGVCGFLNREDFCPSNHDKKGLPISLAADQTSVFRVETCDSDVVNPYGNSCETGDAAIEKRNYNLCALNGDSQAPEATQKGCSAGSLFNAATEKCEAL
jgi:hypothetical protein